MEGPIATLELHFVATLRIHRRAFEVFKELVVRNHWMWPGPVFTVNPGGRIWPFACNGYTPESERDYVEGMSPLVDLVAEELLRIRLGGGRFFIDERGAFYRPGSEHIQFVRFEIRD